MTDKISLEQAQAITSEILTAADEILARHGIERSSGKFIYGGYYRVAIEGHLIGAPKPIEEAWNHLAEEYGLPIEGLGKTFRAEDGRTLQIVGLNPRARRMPVELTDIATGKGLKASAAWVARQLAEVTP